MTIAVADLLGRCRASLLDPVVAPATDGVYWSNAELLGHLNAGTAAIVQLDNKAYVVNAAVKLQAGTRQQLPGDAVALAGVRRNLGSDGATPGRAVSVVRMEQMDAARPGWHADPPTAVVRHCMASEADPRRFYVWPPSDGSGYVEVVYEGVPDDVTLTDNFPLPDLYAEAAYQFVLAHAYAKNSKRGDTVKSQFWWQLFRTTLGVDEAAIERLKIGVPDV